MSHASKEGFYTLLKERKLDELVEAVLRRKSSIRYLNRLLYDPDELVRRRAVEAMGLLADRLAAEDPEQVRVLLRKLLWTINDESGGIGWSAPECIGEIIYRRPEMFGEFAPVVLSCADEEMLRRGVLWAAGRIAEARPELVRESLPDFAAFLDDPDPVLRGYALRLFANAGEKPGSERISRLLGDRRSIPVYEDGQLKETTVAGLAARLV